MDTESNAREDATADAEEVEEVEGAVCVSPGLPEAAGLDETADETADESVDEGRDMGSPPAA
ncbi:hypothetical protein ACFZC6_31720 [Streptomyces ossamyceticus]|uniref:hypothetical protein n=1 Tax=Streptomyces ossamyceticus TaxID=249581 RepID=UPI0036F177FE